MIKVMDETLINKISAGEIVLNLVSVVKELVENSIDASSSEIKIELNASGLESITVIDNGIGMDKNDAKLAFLPHASSKVICDDDLYHIKTLGFRGEALPSIASVSDIVLITSNKIEGTLVHIKGGKTIEVKTSDLRCGTKVIVKNLFYNTPARLKHLKASYKELSLIVDYINKISLSYPNIAFKLINDNKILFQTDGSNNILKVINAIYGIDKTKKMLEINNSNNDYNIKGFISTPDITKQTRNHIICLVNKRVVKNNELINLINDAYHTFKPDDKYPIVILHIDTDPSLIDVNIHPTKSDIKFSKMDLLGDLIFNTIKVRLKEETLIPEIINKEIKEENINISFDFKIPQIEEKTPIISEKEEIYNKEEKELSYKKRLPILYPVGSIHGTYLVFENELGMYLIDQHAANERINYEKYLTALSNPNTDLSPLLIPINIELSNKDYIILKENIDILEKIGLEVEEFGINTICVKKHPTWINPIYLDQDINKIIELVIEKEKDFSYTKFVDHIAMSIACKKSIKANTKISIEEMEVLVNDLRKCDNPFNCPHGRPTIVVYTKNDLEKSFKRIMD